MRLNACILALLFSLLWYTAPQPARCQNEDCDNQSIFEGLRVFADVLSMIEQQYVDPREPYALLYDAMQGMVSRLDPHSAFLPPKRYHEMQIETRGTFGGLGLEVTIQDGLLTVVAPIEDTPADRAGIQSGDRIIAIEEESTRGMNIEQAVDLMRGPPGSQISITVAREGVAEPLPFTITRAVITIRSVRSHRLADDFGYIRIAMFQEHTAEECARALKNLMAAESPIKGLVLDLRDNPGGLLTEAIALTDLFLDNGTIVSTRGRITADQAVYAATAEPPAIDLPLVIMINAGTASGSEIVAGALQDYHRAIILGQPSFGKGTVQTIFPLRDGAGLRLTTSRYYTPADRSIQERGIVPDILVADGRSAEQIYRRTTIRERDLENHLRNTGEQPDETAATTGDDDAHDNQLQTAVAILKGNSIIGQKNFEQR